MSKYLIIGANGTLGTEFRTRLPKEQTIATDSNTLDITDKAAIKQFFDQHKPEIVINCAAYTNVDGAEENYDTALKINSEAVLYLSESCNAISAKLIHFSTGMVFDGKDPNGYAENDPTHPINKYGQSKLNGETNISANCDDYLIIRTSWLYGKPINDSAKKSFVELMLELGKSGTVKGVTDELGKPTWTKDLVESVLNLINSEAAPGIYHLVNEGTASRLDWATHIYQLKNVPVTIEPVSGSDFPRPAKRPHYELLNNTKASKLRTWQEALQEYLHT